jgi:hypothetical protein
MYEVILFCKPRQAQPRLVQPRLDQPRLAQPSPAQTSLAQSSPAQPSLAQPRLAQPRLAQPRLFQPRLALPRLVQPRLDEPNRNCQKNAQNKNLNSQRRFPDCDRRNKESFETILSNLAIIKNLNWRKSQKMRIFLRTIFCVSSWASMLPETGPTKLFTLLW